MINKRPYFLLVFVASTLQCVQGRADRKPDSPKDATHIVVGTVERVFHRESKEQNQYIVQIKVQSVERGKSVKKGDRLLVYCFQRKSSAIPIPAESGHMAIPKEGQKIRVLAKPRNGLLEGIYPDWFSVVDTTKQGAAKGDVGKLQGKRRVIGLKATAKTDDQSNEYQKIANVLAKLKPDIDIKLTEKPNTAPILLYTIEGKTLGGKSVSICDIRNCRIAVVGADVSNSRSIMKAMNLRVSGLNVEEEQIVKDTKGNKFFASKYVRPKANCRFHNFEFDLTDRLLSYGAKNKLGFRTKGTLWANQTNAGVLILFSASTGKFTTHAMRPQSKRVDVPGIKFGSKKKGK